MILELEVATGIVKQGAWHAKEGPIYIHCRHSFTHIARDNVDDFIQVLKVHGVEVELKKVYTDFKEG